MPKYRMVIEFERPGEPERKDPCDWHLNSYTESKQTNWVNTHINSKMTKAHIATERLDDPRVNEKGIVDLGEVNA